MRLDGGDDDKAQREEDGEEGERERQVVAPHVARELGLAHQVLQRLAVLVVRDLLEQTSTCTCAWTGCDGERGRLSWLCHVQTAHVNSRLDTPLEQHQTGLKQMFPELGTASDEVNGR